MMKKSFNKGVKRIIELLDYEFFIVLANKNIKCTCLEAGTGQANPACPKCLGTGKKIKIRKVKGAAQDSSVPSTTRATTDFIVSRNYYILTTFELNPDDIIVDKDGPWNIFQCVENRSFDGEEQYKKCSCIPKKMDAALFMKNFNKIVGR